MKISIITVVYNNKHTIEGAISSVLSQTYKNIEYIIIDGNSTDGTLDIIKKFGKSITKLVSENDLGIYDAMNKGINLATGDIIGILNSDDLYSDENVLMDVYNEFKTNKDLKILFGDLVYVNQHDTKKVIRNWKSKNYYNSFFEDGNVPPHPSLFIRKEVYDECGLFNTNFKLAADYDFMLRIFKKFGSQSKFLPRLMVRMRLGGATNKSVKNIINGNKEILNSWKNNKLKAPMLLMPKRFLKRLYQFIG